MNAIRRLIFPSLLLALLLACAGGPAEPVGDISPDALLARSGGDDAPLILDVRSPEEFAQGHVPGAVNMAYDQVPARVDELAVYRDGDVVVYCEHGGRAGKAAASLQAAGFNVLHLEGDMSGWRKAGRPTEP